VEIVVCTAAFAGAEEVEHQLGVLRVLAGARDGELRGAHVGGGRNARPLLGYCKTQPGGLGARGVGGRRDWGDERRGEEKRYDEFTHAPSLVPRNARRQPPRIATSLASGRRGVVARELAWT